MFYCDFTLLQLWKTVKTTFFTWCFCKMCHMISLRNTFGLTDIRDKVFKNGPSKICGRQPLKNLGRPYPFNFFKGCIPQILLDPFFKVFFPYISENRGQTWKCKLSLVLSGKIRHTGTYGNKWAFFWKRV